MNEMKNTPAGAGHEDIWIFAETNNGTPAPVTAQLIGSAAALKEELVAAGKESTVTAVLFGSGVEAAAKTLIASGAEQVVVVDDPALAVYKPRTWKKALVTLLQKYQPSIFLLGATPLGRDLAPRAAAALGTGLTADATALGFDENGQFYQTTPAYGGNVLVNIAIPEARPQMATLRVNVFDPLPLDASRTGTVVREEIAIEDDPAYEVLGSAPKGGGFIPLGEADVIISGGRGIRSKEDLSMLHELADLLGGQVGCSRPLCDRGWYPHDRQIGQSGETVKPKLIMNIAVSGAMQYTAGMDKSGCILSINYTENTPVFALSHYAAVNDYRDILPALIREIRARRAAKAGAAE